jgi:glycosyltransferase involved in cell wall biosynthesis
MKPLKIVHLSGFAPYKPPGLPTNDNDYYFVSSWAGLIARRLKQYKPDMDIEIWRTEDEFDEMTEKEIFNIKGVIWPYKKSIIRNLLTLGMVKKLNELKKSYFIILHYHDLFNLRFVIFIKLLCPGINVVLSHHGGVPPKPNTIKGFLMKLFYNKRIVTYITYLSLGTKIYLDSIKLHPPFRFLPVGADFEQFKPINKAEIRKELGLDPDLIYGIYVGKFYKLKSVDLILDSFYKLKSKYNFSVIFVGGRNSPENDLYDEVINSGCPWYGVKPWLEMVKYYNAADFYIHPALNPAFGGLDVSWIEALACNKPVLSPQLAYLDFDYLELGVFIKDESELIEKTEWMINNYNTFSKCREVSKEQLDGNTAIMRKLVQIYDEIYC